MTEEYEPLNIELKLVGKKEEIKSMLETTIKYLSLMKSDKASLKVLLREGEA